VLEEHDEPPASTPESEERASREEKRALVAAVLEALSMDQRAVFVLHDLEERAVPEIATMLGIPLNTAYSRLRLAREQFAAAVRRLQLRGSR